MASSRITLGYCQSLLRRHPALACRLGSVLEHTSIKNLVYLRYFSSRVSPQVAIFGRKVSETSLRKSLFKSNGISGGGGCSRLPQVSAPRLVRSFSDEYKKSHPRPDEENPQSQQPNWPQLIFGIVALLVYYMLQGSDSVPNVSFPYFLKNMLNIGEVHHLEVSGSRQKVYIYLHPGANVMEREVRPHGPHFVLTISNPDTFEEQLRQAQLQLGVKPSNFIPVTYHRSSDDMFSFLGVLFTAAILIGVVFLLTSRKSKKDGDIQDFMKDMNPFSQMSKAKTTIFYESSPGKIKMCDVAGMTEAKQEVMEFIDYLKSSSRFTRLGAKIPKGALLYGPPGTGKTLLAKAVAGEASVPFISVAGSDFVEMFAGVGSARVRDLFSQARGMAPAILYIDEIDAIGRSRKSGPAMGGHNEQESTLNQLLVEMDGINPLEGVIIMASTNRADVLDKALLRPGRFDRQILIELPTRSERMEIFELYLKQLKLSKCVDEFSSRLAALTPGHSGADIANICNEAALHAARSSRETVSSDNLEYAIERVIAGMEKQNNPLTSEEREVVAYHESGHALVGWQLEHTDPILKLSIVPRTKGMLGFAQYLPSDQHLHTREQVLDRMCMTMGGRAAEAVVFRKITTNAQDDIKKVTEMAYKAITVFGLSPVIGNVSFPSKEELGMGIRPFSMKLAQDIDREVQSMIASASLRAEGIIESHQDKLKLLAENLLSKEILNYDDILNILGPAPFQKSFHHVDIK